MAVENLSGIFQIVSRILAASWWMLLPLIFFPIFLESWLMFIRFNFIIKIKWKLLEIKIPREILKTPKAMEQVFTTLYNMYDKKKFLDVWWKGEVQEWASFELTGSAGQIHFYMRVPEKYRNMAESAIYAQYPDVEIVEIDDYIDLVPSVLPNKIFNLFGANFVLARDSSYPIRTYEYFEERVKEKRLDPMAVVTEAMAKTEKDEMAWLQFLIRPVGDEWKEEGVKLAVKLFGRKESKERTFSENLVEFFANLIKAPFVHPVWSEEKNERSPGEINILTPGEKDAVAAIENKISKYGFETIIKFIYIDKADSFTMHNVPSILGAFRQFNTQNLNAFKIDSKTLTKTKAPFKARKLYIRKRRIFDAYRLRFFPIMRKKFSILNTEELATIFHFPTIFVEAPTLQRLESKRGEPPAELPIGE